MCLIVLAWKTHPDYPLILLANRDEFRQRPTAPLQAWDTQPVIYAGQDLEHTGTWLGSSANGRFAAVTNLRQPTQASSGTLSRGQLVKDFLMGRQNPSDYLGQISIRAGQYPGFNLLAGNTRNLMYYSNGQGNPRLLTPGIYALSNGPLGVSWPKIEESKVAFTRLISKREPDIAELLALMQSRKAYPDHMLPQTGLSPAQEQALSPIFIDLPDYGTRSTTLLSWHRQGQAQMLERSYLAGAEHWQDQALTFEINP